MRRRSVLLLSLVLLSNLFARDHGTDHQWLKGKVVDQNRARYLASIYHSGTSTTNTHGTISGTADSTTTGANTNTSINGTYSGTSSTHSSASDIPLYKVYEDLVVEGDDMVYVTQERLRWKWSKPAHVTVNGQVKYYPDGRKLHVLDEDGKEHVVEIVKQIKKEAPK